jgi:hypothetical protein
MSDLPESAAETLPPLIKETFNGFYAFIPLFVKGIAGTTNT